jgi:invasion protein IalB
MTRSWRRAALVTLFATTAAAQTPPAAPAPAPDPAPERQWAVTCTEAAPPAPRECRLAASAVLLPQNRRVLAAVLLRQPETRSLALVFQLPHGAALPAGLAWQVDEAEPQRLAFQASDAEGLYAGVPVSDDLLNTLRRGTNLRVTWLAGARRDPVAVALPLAQFAEGAAQFFAEERRTP